MLNIEQENPQQEQEEKKLKVNNPKDSFLNKEVDTNPERKSAVNQAQTQSKKLDKNKFYNDIKINKDEILYNHSKSEKEDTKDKNIINTSHIGSTQVINNGIGNIMLSEDPLKHSSKVYLNIISFLIAMIILIVGLDFIFNNGENIKSIIYGKKVTVHFKTDDSDTRPVEIPKGECLGNKYFEPKPTGCHFSHWELQGTNTKVTRDTKIEEGCILIAKYTVTVHLETLEDSNIEIEIPKGTSLDDKYFESKPTGCHFSHWKLQGTNTKVTKYTKIEEDCTLIAKYTVIVHFKTENLEFLNKDIEIPKGTSLDDQYYKPEYPLFEFVCWKFPNDTILTCDTLIDSDTTVYAEYKNIDPEEMKRVMKEVYDKGKNFVNKELEEEMSNAEQRVKEELKKGFSYLQNSWNSFIDSAEQNEDEN